MQLEVLAVTEPQHNRVNTVKPTNSDDIQRNMAFTLQTKNRDKNQDQPLRAGNDYLTESGCFRHRS